MRPLLSNISKFFVRIFTNHPAETLTAVENTTVKITKTVDGYVMPVRETIFKRFPVLFGFLVTLGVVATFLGIEQLLLKSNILQNSPELILILGLCILAFTGKLYKKLE
jgi:hypothetical protein